MQLNFASSSSPKSRDILKKNLKDIWYLIGELIALHYVWIFPMSFPHNELPHQPKRSSCGADESVHTRCKDPKPTLCVAERKVISSPLYLVSQLS